MQRTKLKELRIRADGRTASVSENGLRKKGSWGSVATRNDGTIRSRIRCARGGA